MSMSRGVTGNSPMNYSDSLLALMSQVLKVAATAQYLPIYLVKHCNCLAIRPATGLIPSPHKAMQLDLATSPGHPQALLKCHCSRLPGTMRLRLSIAPSLSS